MSAHFYKRQEPAGIRCPDCGARRNHHVKTLDLEGRMALRRKRCIACQAQFVSLEMVLPERVAGKRLSFAKLRAAVLDAYEDAP